MPFTVPILSVDEIKKTVEDFCSEYGIPRIKRAFPIEEVIEQSLNITISFNKELISKHDIEACTVRDFSRIIIDEGLPRKSLGHYRLVLAHEVGHYALHRDVLNEQFIDSVEEWIAFRKALNDDAGKRMEYQSDTFASHLLMPDRELKQYLQERSIGDLFNTLKRRHNNDGEARRMTLKKMANEASDAFGISIPVAENRIEESSDFVRGTS
ncbi:MAG: ImmA/IrrE family metallo-endopeptidase [Chitinispirillia bacterium]|nr:ImmA/IrrE family metallo-endopeptidase [Chitinispirillia bacterium]